jgi:hypothetical protein
MSGKIADQMEKLEKYASEVATEEFEDLFQRISAMPAVRREATACDRE